jgi:hypothetical protein
MTSLRTLVPATRVVPLCAALLLLAPSAHAESQLTRHVYTNGAFIGTDGYVQNLLEGVPHAVDPLTVASYVTCVAPHEGEVGCSFDPALQPPITHWYQREGLPTSAAAQAQADWGVARVRSFSGGAASGEIEVPNNGSRSYYATATAEWQEALTYVAAAPGVVTFEVRLHGSWNDYGRLAAYGGIPHDEADAADWIDGQRYDNCIFAQSGVSCAPGWDGGETFFLPGDDADSKSGSVDRLVRFSAILRPSSDPRDDEDPTPVGPTDFLIGLAAASSYRGAEVDAFNTLRLERVILQPGAAISFGSGTQYLVTTAVPEPATWAFWVLGFAGMAAQARRRLSQKR